MARSSPTDGFRLAYEHSGSGAAVVLLHGWPGDKSDFRRLVPLLQDSMDIVVPDFRGFGESDKHARPAKEAYSVGAQARSIVSLIHELELAQPILVGYDIGSRVAQEVARNEPDLIRALIISPPLPGAGQRVFTIEAQREFWYQAFHQLDLVEQLIDGNENAVRSYLQYIWEHWSGPTFHLANAELDHLVEVYGRPGDFVASIGWYRAGAGMVERSATEQPPHPAERISTPTTVLWPEYDPLFPPQWSDCLSEFFSTFEVRELKGVGHFTPLEAPSMFAAAILEHLK